jgi:hypothetical protein
LLGYRIEGLYNNEWTEDSPATDHFSIVHTVWEKGYVQAEVSTALSGYKSREATQNPITQIYGNSPDIKGRQPFSISFGWSSLGKK